MAASKSGFMKDALILFAITLVSGLCLGVVCDKSSDRGGYHRSQQRNL